jgi:hypothetical protein
MNPVTNLHLRKRMTSHTGSNKQEQGQQSCNQTLFLWFGSLVWLFA